MGRPLHGDLPLQHVTTGDGGTSRVAALQIEELLQAGIAQVALLIPPQNQRVFQELSAQFGPALVAVEQPEPRGHHSMRRPMTAPYFGWPGMLALTVRF